MKYLAGTVFGIAAALVLPVHAAPFPEAIAFLADLAIRIGRYVVLPLVFFTCATAVYELLETRRLFLPFGVTALVIVASTALLSLVGAASILLVHAPRIPVPLDKVADTVALGPGALLGALFPQAGFAALLNEDFLLPAFLLALLVGVACARERSDTKPVMYFFTAAVKVVNFISHVVQDVLTIGLVAVACRWTILFSGALASGVYLPLLRILLADFLLVALVLYPGAVFLICRVNPYKVLYQGIAPLIAAFFSGDTNFALPVTLRHVKELIGNRNPLAPFTASLFSVFARGGSALTSCVCFVVILHSYSNLGLTTGSVLWMLLMSFALSFLLAGLPSGGAFVLLTVLCARYGQGFEAGYLLLRPAAPLICAFACGVDALTNVFGSFIVARKIGV
jgi:Na+/H+-dicarboxylate symporter